MEAVKEAEDQYLKEINIGKKMIKKFQKQRHTSELTGM